MSNANNNENNDDEIIHDSIVEVSLPAVFGDLVEVEGYGQRVFKVFGYRIEQCYTQAEEWSDVIYEVIDAVNGEWLEADVEDIELLADAEDEAVYMQTVDIANYPMSFMQVLNSEMGGVDMAGKDEGKPEMKLTAREQSSQEAQAKKQARKDAYKAMDNELDRYNFYKARFAETGDDAFKVAMDTVMAGLRKEDTQ